MNGTLLWKLKEGLLNKTETRYEGPFVVVGRAKIGNYFIKDTNEIFYHEPLTREKLKLNKAKEQKPKEVEMIWQQSAQYW